MERKSNRKGIEFTLMRNGGEKKKKMRFLSEVEKEKEGGTRE